MRMVGTWARKLSNQYLSFYDVLLAHTEVCNPRILVYTVGLGLRLGGNYQQTSSRFKLMLLRFPEYCQPYSKMLCSPSLARSFLVLFFFVYLILYYFNHRSTTVSGEIARRIRFTKSFIVICPCTYAIVRNPQGLLVAVFGD